MVNLYNQTCADPAPYNVRPSNSSREPTAPVAAVRFDKDAPYYDMSGDKYLIILNHHTFEKTKHFKYKPSTRNGTYNDEGRLRQVFHRLGFLTFVFRNLKYQEIIDRLTSIASLDHSRTSCICITILTHGDKGGKVFAADQPYKLSEVMDIFGKQVNLINKPKLFFVQACRGGNMDAGHIVTLSTECDSQLLTLPAYCYSEMTSRHYSSFEEVMMIMEQPQKADARSFSFSLLDSLKVCGGCWKEPDDSDTSGQQNRSFLTVPTHADTLVVCSTVEDFLSYRDGSGSWMIQALCDAIQNNHEDQNLLDMIIQMNRTVAYDKITVFCRLREMNKKKQMPETRFTLTKHLKF